MSAWKHHAYWSEKTIADYRAYAAMRAKVLFCSLETLDCANFCLQILIEYAADSGLPVCLRGNAGDDNHDQTFRSRDDTWSDKTAFMDAVLLGIEVKELIDASISSNVKGDDFHNTSPIALHDLQSGDMLAHLSEAPIGKRAGTWGHMQLVVSSTLGTDRADGVPTYGAAEIYQGNLEPRFVILGSKPTYVQKGNYWFDGDQFEYQREGQSKQDGAALWRSMLVTPVRWNYTQFNGVEGSFDRVDSGRVYA